VGLFLSDCIFHPGSYVCLTKEVTMSRHYSEKLDEYFYDEDPDDPGTKFCLECGEEVNIVKEDFGIGSYEFWGSRGFHHDYHWVCPKCEGSEYIDVSNAGRCHRCGTWVDRTKTEQTCTEDEEFCWCKECEGIATEECEGCEDYFTPDEIRYGLCIKCRTKITEA